MKVAALVLVAFTLAADPEGDAAAAVTRGQALMDEDKPTEALVEFRRAQQLSPTPGRAMNVFLASLRVERPSVAAGAGAAWLEAEAADVAANKRLPSGKKLLTALAASAQSVEEDVARLNGEKVALQAQVASLRRQIDETLVQVGSLQGNLGTCNLNRLTLENNYATLEKEFNKYKLQRGLIANPP